MSQCLIQNAQFNMYNVYSASVEFILYIAELSYIFHDLRNAVAFSE